MLRLSTFAGDVLAALAAAASVAMGGPVTITDPGTGDTAALTITATGDSNGVNIKLTGNGTTTPSKFFRVLSGVLQVVNSAYNAVILTLSDGGALAVTGSVTCNGVVNTGHLSGVGGGTPIASVGTLVGGSTDTRGGIGIPGGTVSATITFATPFASPPFVVLTGTNSGTIKAVSTGTSSMTITLNSNMGGETVYWVAMQ